MRDDRESLFFKQMAHRWTRKIRNGPRLVHARLVTQVDGKKRLPVFSSQEKMTVFASKMSTELNKVFSLGCIQTLLENVTKSVDVDFVDLNLFSQKSWEIGMRKK